MILLDVPKSLPPNKLESIGISAKTNKEHLKLWQGYAKKNNEILKLLEKVDKKESSAIYSEYRALKIEQTFAYGGWKNHDVYFNHLNGAGKPTPEFRALIKPSFGTFENWMEDFVAVCMSGRGWGFCCYNEDLEIVENIIGDSQNSYPIWNSRLLCCVDIYEHAFFNDFSGDKSDYVNSVLSIFDYAQIMRNLK